MTNWIQEEGRKAISERQAKTESERQIKVSNFWANLIRQLEKDVEMINQDKGWQSVFNGAISFQRTDLGVKISRTSFPSIFDLKVEYIGDYVEVNSRYIKTQDDLQQENVKENHLKYDIVAQNGGIQLKNGTSYYLVPEEASKAILALLVTAKNDAIMFFEEEIRKRSF